MHHHLAALTRLHELEVRQLWHVPQVRACHAQDGLRRGRALGLAVGGCCAGAGPALPAATRKVISKVASGRRQTAAILLPLPLLLPMVLLLLWRVAGRLPPQPQHGHDGALLVGRHGAPQELWRRKGRARHGAARRGVDVAPRWRPWWPGRAMVGGGGVGGRSSAGRPCVCGGGKRRKRGRGGEAGPGNGGSEGGRRGDTAGAGGLRWDWTWAQPAARAACAPARGEGAWSGVGATCCPPYHPLGCSGPGAASAALGRGTHHHARPAYTCVIRVLSPPLPRPAAFPAPLKRRTAHTAHLRPAAGSAAARARCT